MAQATGLSVSLPPDLGGEPVHARVFQGLRRGIMTGHFPPGQAVTIRGLASELGVSAMPVREALRRLVAERALEILDNRRVRVPNLTAMRFEELLVARVALETEAAVRALPLIDSGRLEKLRETDHAIDAAIKAGEAHRVVEMNFEFHLTLYNARPGSVFVPLIESIWLQTGPFMRLALETPPLSAVDRHKEALSAVAAGDPEGLRHAIAADIREGIGHLARSLNLAPSEDAADARLAAKPRRAARRLVKNALDQADDASDAELT